MKAHYRVIGRGVAGSSGTPPIPQEPPVKFQVAKNFCMLLSKYFCEYV